MVSQHEYRVVAAYDTETCNIPQEDGTARAYAILYILNDFSRCPLVEYVPDTPLEIVTFDRHADEFIIRLEDIMRRGLAEKYTPIICAYNLMFDMQTIMLELGKRYDMKVSAQSTTNVYTLDLYAKGADKDKAPALLRFWDTFFLEQNGLKAMGETAGVAKATGDWDYTLIRTPETPLTEEELFYAKRDVQVIPAYLRYLIHANEWLDPKELGVRVLTKTSIVRRMAAETFGHIKVGHDKRGREVDMLTQFMKWCKADMPKTYESYALRKACFRGGWTFTSGKHAMQVMRNVASLDVTSMHHTFINGMYVPRDFHKASQWELSIYVKYVCGLKVEDVLKYYVQPFNCAFHAAFDITNIRPRKGSVFEKHGILLAPRGKFAKHGEWGEWVRSEADTIADEAIRENGFHDSARNVKFAFGKLVSADECIMYLNEIELWTMAQVYEWDAIKPLFGEATISWKRPPDYVTLQSNLLYQRKNDCKQMNKLYDGTPYEGDIPASIPQGIADGMRDGTLSHEFLTAYYQSTVKGSFNSVYGTMAQDVFKPDYLVETGEIKVGEPVTPENYTKKMPKTCKVLYTYGMRIVGRSRMHLCIAMMLLDKRFGDKVTPTGGDTDSIKCACAPDVTDAEINECLKPIADASTKAIATACAHIRRTFPEYASTLDKVGSFDIEPCAGTETRWEHHMELWNKARVSESHGTYHVTCAGLSRPIGRYHVERVLEDLHKTSGGFEHVAGTAIGYNVSINAEISFSLQRKRPKLDERIQERITDYLGHTVDVDLPAAVALYGDTRELGDTTKQTNLENWQYMRANNIIVDVRHREVGLDENGNPYVALGMFDDILIQGKRTQ